MISPCNRPDALSSTPRSSAASSLDAGGCRSCSPALLFVLYYGYIILIATNRQLVSRPVSGATTTGILIAAGVIAGAWVLTATYVVWANRHYDPAVADLRARAEKH